MKVLYYVRKNEIVKCAYNRISSKKTINNNIKTI
jgi:hypothetical protein